MSRRRKTLCHAEIENFLSELQTDTSAQQPIVPVDVPLAMDLTKPSRDSHPQISKFVFKSEEELNRDAHLLMRERIRQYVKHSFHIPRQLDFPDEVLNVARAIKETCSYHVVPLRQLQPDAFPYRPESIESKRAVIIGLAPMLDEAEKQRKIDVACCETATRCRVESKRSRASWYQYSDLDSPHHIDPSEYEDRYIKFLHHIKQSREDLVSASRMSPNRRHGVAKKRDVLKPVSANVGRDIAPDSAVSKTGSAENKTIILKKDNTDNGENIILADDLGSPAVLKKERASNRASTSSRRSSIMIMFDKCTSNGERSRTKKSTSSSPNVSSSPKSKIPTYAQTHKSSNSPANKEKPKLIGERRVTLSPGRMKAMLEIALADDAVSEDEEGFSACSFRKTEAITCEPNELSREAASELGQFLLFCDTDDIKISSGQLGTMPTNFDNCVTCDFDVVVGPASEYKLDPPTSNDDLTAGSSTSILKSAIEPLATVSENGCGQDPLNDQFLMCDEIKLSENVLIADNSEAKSSSTGMNENNSDEIILIMESGLDCPKERARCRLFLRMEVARWRYGWEIASIAAANAAVQRIKSL